MSMVVPILPEELENLQIPDDEIGRQAVNSLRGYIYQIYQTLSAWLTLGEDEILLLEVAEDFAVLAKGELTATQVKDTPASGSVTLRTKSVSSAINTLWRFQNANPDKIVRINYLTTSEIGTEKGLTFPDNHNGLNYWCVAAREGTNVEPLRQALLSLDLLVEIKDFVKVATPDELRDRIFRRITWVCGTHDRIALDQIIRDRLVYLGERQGFSPSDSERAKDTLVGAILNTIIRKSDRILSRAELLRIFEKSATISVPATTARQLIEVGLRSQVRFSPDLVSGTGIIVKVAHVPLPPRVIDRKALVSELISGMGRLGSVWLHGSSGLGKTVLAQLIARQSKRDWLLVQLRDCSPAELEYRLCRVLQASQSGRIGGLILDDFPTKYAHSARLRLAMLANEVHRMNGSLLVTSAKPPSANTQSCFGENGALVVEVPYLSREEVSELVTLGDGDAEKWAGVIHAFCGFGHPQLVQARISGLQQRNWPDDELLAGIPVFGAPAKEVEGERDSIRERLLSELSQNTRELLYRLTLLVGYFDRELAITVGEVHPAIERPGEALDILLGPWVEALASDRFRVSPLVSSAGIQSLCKPIQMEVHKRIVDQLIARHPFPADFLGMLLSHALVSRHERGLMWLTMAILNTRDEDRTMISEHLFVLPLLDAQQPLFKENIHVSAMLRLAQFRVAAWANKTDCLPGIADQLITEARMIDHKEIADGFLYLAISSVIVEQSLRISPRKWMPLIRELEQLLNGQGALIEHVRELYVIKEGLNGLSVPQFLFAIRASALRSIGELVELFTELDGLEEDRRSLLLSSLDRIPHGRRLMIDAPWLAEMREGKLNGVAAAGTYAQVTAVAEKWRERDIAVECECARAVMLNEYADDSEGALASLGEAERKHPNNPRLLRERAKIYYSNGDHGTALATIEQVVDAIPKDDHIERAFALREAAVSATKTGHLQKAGDYFAKAYGAAAAAAGVGMQRMAIGLKADCALVKFQSGDGGDAIELIRQAIMDAEQLDPKADTKAGFCRLVLPQLILWMQAQVKKIGPTQCDFPMVVGCCSNPDPPDRVIDMPCPPLLASWYELAVLELMLRTDSGIVGELRKRTSTHRIISCELALNYHLMAKYVITVDIERFFSYLPEYVSKTAYMRENASSASKENIYDLIDADLSVIKPVDWKSDLHLQNAKDAILALAAAAVCSDVKDIREQLLNHVGRNQESAIALQPFIDSFEKQTCPKGDAFEITAYYLGRLMKANAYMSPDEMFIVTYRLWEWLPHTFFKDIIEYVIADYLSGCWRKIIEDQRFQLQRPMIAVPAIQTAIKETAGSTVRIAKLLLAAEIAVRHKLGANLRSKLQEHCLQNQKGGTS